MLVRGSSAAFDRAGRRIASHTASRPARSASSAIAASCRAANSMVRIGVPPSTPTNVPSDPGVAYPICARTCQRSSRLAAACANASARFPAGPSKFTNGPPRDTECSAITASGLNASRSACTARASGSLNGASPRCECAEKFVAGKFRFRSTPRALPRVRVAVPSGLASRMTRIVHGSGDAANAGRIASSARLPCGSFPCIEPTIRIRAAPP